MNCDIDKDTLCCSRCGSRVSAANVKRNCGTAGLGDMVAAGLEAVGITKERVSAALGVEDCGCSERQSALNALGRKLGIGVTRSDESSAPPAGES
jgi:hypothetical protein